MARETRPKWWPRVLSAAHYGFPVCMLIFAWFAFREGDPAYRHSTVETYLACSAVVIITVFTGEMAWALSSMRDRLERHANHLRSHKAEIERLEAQLIQLRNASSEGYVRPIDPDRSISQEQIPRSNETTIRYQDADPPQPATPQNTVQSELTRPSPGRLSEKAAILAIKSEFTEACKSQNRDLRQLLGRLQTLIEESAPTSFRAVRVSRDGAIEESAIYRADATGIATPKDSIAILIGGNQALLFPAPLAGEDSFVDAKAFESDMPVHQRKRKNLSDCDPALLAGTERDGFELHKKGALRFHHV